MFSKCGHRPAKAASPGNWLEIQILSSQPRPADSETLGGGAQRSAFQQVFQVILMHTWVSEP